MQGKGFRSGSLTAILAAAFAAAVAAGGSSCGDDTDTTPDPVIVVTPAEFGTPYDTLEEWHLFADAVAQTPADDVVPYDVISPLFSDYALKYRFMWIPEGQKIGYVDGRAWDFPVGSILVKTFAYADDLREPEGGRRLLETRILWREPEGWTAHTYIWNEEQTEATRQVGGKFIPITFVNAQGETQENNYRVPNTNECQDCHYEEDEEGENSIILLGPKTRQLDRTFDYGAGPVNQIDHLAELGWFDTEPTAIDSREHFVNPFEADAGDVSTRVRSYFDANCAGCHRPNGFADTSALLLDWDSTDPETQPDGNWGVCKIPTSPGPGSCGLVFDVVPGDPDNSIMMCRVTSTDIEVRMPPLGSRVVHEEGVALIREWIEAMEGSCN